MVTADIATNACRIHFPQLGVSPVESNPMGFKSVAFEMPTNTDQGDTLVINLREFNIKLLRDIWVFEHTTTDSVVVSQSTEMTSTVASGVLRVTFDGSGIENKKRVVLVWGE